MKGRIVAKKRFTYTSDLPTIANIKQTVVMIWNDNLYFRPHDSVLLRRAAAGGSAGSAGTDRVYGA